MPKGMPGPTDFQLVFETDAEATLLIDETAQVVAVSAGYLRATGLARSAVLEHSLFDLPPYREQPVLKQRLQEALDGIRQSVLMHSVALEGAAGTDSRPPWAWDNARPLPSPDGSVRFTVHSFRGATTGTPSESQRERRLRKLIEHSYDVIALFDGMGRVQFVSPSVRRILGYSEEQFVALPPLELVHPDDAAQFGRKINELYGQPGGFLVQRVRTRHADGSWRTNEVASWNLLHDPDVAAVVSNFRDITPHVELAAALERKNEHLQLTLTAARDHVGRRRPPAQGDVLPGLPCVLPHAPRPYRTDPRPRRARSDPSRRSRQRPQVGARVDRIGPRAEPRVPRP